MTADAVKAVSLTLGRLAFAVIVIAAALWFALAVTVAQVFAERAPEKALGWGLGDARAEAGIAAGLLGQGVSAKQVRGARERAEQSILRDATAVRAASILGLIADLSGSSQNANRLFLYAESLSRRDLPTQFWLIEAHVKRDDVPGALRHYDRALRTSRRSRDVLIPILVNAAADPAVIRPLAGLVAVRPPWWQDFIPHLIQGSASPDAIATLVGAVRLDLNQEFEAGNLQFAMTKLAGLGAFDQAYGLYRAARPGAGKPDGIRNGDFAQEGGIAPFDWSYVDEFNFGAYRQARDSGGNIALFLTSGEGRGGEVARQLLLLTPGRHRLQAEIGDIAGDPISRPSIRLSCSGKVPLSVLDWRLPPAPERGAKVVQEFEVPAKGCGGQLLSIHAGMNFGNGSKSPWIDSLTVIE